MKQKDYYAILNVSREASEHEIRKAYRQLALKYHPDKNPGDKTTEAKFREIKEAYDLLRDSLERSFYDQHHLPERGQDLEYKLEVSFGNVNSGKQVTFEIEGRKIKLTLNKGDGTYRLRGEGKVGVYGGEPGDLLVLVSTTQLRQTILTNDGAEMILIPRGEFLMGSNDENAHDDEKPVHFVYLDDFYIDKYPVTNAQYKKFLEANPIWNKDNISEKYYDLKAWEYLENWNGNTYPIGKANHPVVYVSWYAAMEYAKWVGKRLPTEAEWEKAARGGIADAIYPWGDSDICRNRNVDTRKISRASTLVSLLDNPIDSKNANYGKHSNGEISLTTPVGSYPANSYGLYDMAGNVNEWCLDGYDEDFYVHSPRNNPILNRNSTHVIGNYTFTNCRVLRGGSWCSFAQFVRVASRGWSNASMVGPALGFRCAKSVVF